ncbi:alpha/beta fold hydrolase [Ferrimonas balearica]|uniref:alpha/beta fold hydrolase n=1 Tax=Ferrimonas balearica TaxID=44012 RepID=UPI001C99587F|nr:alpha/beta hydrolase [Ferrimonas balearica]MBY5923511.1 alpha/beta hydrolase [Ferrimonas balearica]MBY5997940.1 alpha/beta hydrolase [Ferrimonas balearica]
MTSLSPAVPPSMEEWRAAGLTFHWQHHALFYRFHPNPGKPTLLLIHGFPSASWDWWALWPTLSSHYQLLTVDMLGFGLSDKPHPYIYRIADQAQMILDLLSHLAIPQAAILAHDYGDTVAQELMAREQEGSTEITWLSVTLLNGGLFPEAHQPLRIQRLMAGPLGPLLARLLGRGRFQASLKRIWGKTPPDQMELDTLWQLLRYHQGQRVIPSLIQYMAERVTHRSRWVGALQHAAQPLTLIDGLADPISGQQLVDRFRQLCPHGQVAELPGVGHYPQLEAPSAVLSAMQIPSAQTMAE